MKTAKTANTKKAREITEYCNVLLSPIGDYFKKAPEAIVDEGGNLSFDFVLKNPSQPYLSESLSFTAPICNIVDVNNGYELSYAVSPAIDELDNFIDFDWWKKEFGFTDSDIETIQSGFLLIESAFFLEFLYTSDECELGTLFTDD